MPLQRNIIDIDTSKTTQFDGGYNLLYRGEKSMKIIEVDMNVKIKVDSFNFVYGVNGGRRFYKFQVRWLNKHEKALIGDIITIINRLRLESDYEKVNVIDVNVEKINTLKHGVDLVFTSKSCRNYYDDDFNNLYGLVGTGGDYSDLL